MSAIVISNGKTPFVHTSSVRLPFSGPWTIVVVPITCFFLLRCVLYCGSRGVRDSFRPIRRSDRMMSLTMMTKKMTMTNHFDHRLLEWVTQIELSLLRSSKSAGAALAAAEQCASSAATAISPPSLCGRLLLRLLLFFHRVGDKCTPQDKGKRVEKSQQLSGSCPKLQHTFWRCAKM